MAKLKLLSVHEKQSHNCQKRNPGKLLGKSEDEKPELLESISLEAF